MILKPIELFYHFLSGLKNMAYDLNFFPTQLLPAPVISVGNLSFGGTGKTPCIELLARSFLGKKVVIVCRSYKANLTEAQKVNLSLENAANLFGDEAVLLQTLLPQTSVWSGPSKWKTAVACLAEKPDLILIDDGFSHRQLHRQFDLVLFDATRIGNEYFRESLSALKRAHAVILTKTQFAQQEQLNQFKADLKKKFPHLQGSIFSAGSILEVPFGKECPVFAFCGIAKPDSFQNQLVDLGYQIEFFEGYADHQTYSDELQKELAEKFAKLQSQHPQLKMLTTTKDAVKIRDKKLLQVLNVASYQMVVEPQQKEFLLEKIRQIIQR